MHDPAGVLIARVVLESPLPQLDRLFDYAVPQRLRELAVPGVRVRVPLRSSGRFAKGFIVELTSEASFSGTLSELDDIPSAAPVLAPEVWALARRVADRQAGNASDVLRLAIPGRQVRVEKAWLAKRASVTPTNTSGDSEDQTTDASPRALESHADTTSPESNERSSLAEAIAHGARLASKADPHVTALSDGSWVPQWAVALAEAAEVALMQGQSAVLVVPDYRDGAHLVAAVRDRVGDDPLVWLDSRQANPARYAAFLRCLDPEPRIIVGNRSAIYAPAARLGLIAVWDEADPLHRELHAPYSSTRDVALLRQETSSAALLFLDYSRSTDVQRLVELGYVRDATPRRLSKPRVIPTAEQLSQSATDAHARIPSTAWKAVRESLEHGPVLVQVSRPGYIAALSCSSCHTPARCAHCQGPLKSPGPASTAHCGWCGALAAEWACSACESTQFRMSHAGTGRTAEELGRAFPGTRIIVADGEKPILEVDDKPALIIATRGAEPIARAGYAAVLLLDGDRMLSRESLRVAEDCLRWWSNAIALAREGATSYIVGVGGELARTLVTWRHEDFAAAELRDRRRLRFPPAVRVVSITGRPATVSTALESLQAELKEPHRGTFDILGPVDVDGEVERAIVRFDYPLGIAIARSLRSSVIRNATGRRVAGRSRPTPVLRVRFDDNTALE